MSKFIDLEPQVSDYYGTIPGQERRAGICDALRYLDSHPERVPGRTMTAGEVGRRSHLIRGDVEIPSILDFLDALGIAVTPDPEPTNAQSIGKLLTEFANLNASCGGEQGDHDLAEFLDAHGVRVSSDD